MLAPEQIVRHLVSEVLAHRAAALSDDATVLYLQWSPTPAEG